MPRRLRNAASSIVDRAVESAMFRVGPSPEWEAQKLMLGKSLSLHIRSISNVESLADVEFQVFSQWGEDGIAEWIISNLPGIPLSFVELGIEDYTESNTRFLLMNRNWNGLVVDSSEQNIAKLKTRPWFWKYGLTAVAEFITAENVNGILERNGFSGEIGVLSIDIDGNDYWVLDAITSVNPWMVIAEYNSVFGDLRPITVPYRSHFACRSDLGGNIYFGASIAALEAWASKTGYEFLGTTGAGGNAFFLRNDVARPLLDRIRVRRARPALFRTSRSPDGTLSLVSGRARLEVLHGLRVFDVVSGTRTTIGTREDMYSEFWT